MCLPSERWISRVVLSSNFRIKYKVNAKYSGKGNVESFFNYGIGKRRKTAGGIALHKAQLSSFAVISNRFNRFETLTRNLLTLELP